MANSALIYEDSLVSRLAPITTARPAYAVTCGSFRLVDRLRQLGAPLRGLVRPHLRALQQADFPDLNSEHPARLLVNARLVPSADNARLLRRLLDDDRPVVVRHRGELAAAVAPVPLDPSTLVGGDASWLDAFDGLPELEEPAPLLDYPHDVVHRSPRLLGESLDERLESGEYEEVRDGLFVAPGVALGEHLAVRTKDGPILIDRDASIGPHCYLAGPAYIGPRAKLIEHAAIKDACCVGHTVKIGGEVEASIIEPYSNKQHYGFLGHSYLGSWINLGAGTCNSDLKNTYGTINMEYQGVRVATDLQFMGCVIGDYSKSAINTGIFTGKTIGVCSMLYGFVTANVPSFVNYARLFGQVSELPPEVMVATQRRMFSRRQVVQRPCDSQLIQDMFELTRHERQTDEWRAEDRL